MKASAVIIEWEDGKKSRVPVEAEFSGQVVVSFSQGSVTHLSAKKSLDIRELAEDRK